jgi:hypothetical protein
MKTNFQVLVNELVFWAEVTVPASPKTTRPPKGPRREEDGMVHMFFGFLVPLRDRVSEVPLATY